jgi:hypothetical protein
LEQDVEQIGNGTGGVKAGMNALFSGPWFQVGGVPLVIMFVGVFARRLGRRDGDNSPRGNDFAVGTTILLTLLGIVVRDLGAARPEDLPGLVASLALVVFAIVASLDHDRYRSWVRDRDGLPTPTKRMFWGVVFPDAVALVLFGIYQYQKI